jgi:hypothetical protein
MGCRLNVPVVSKTSEQGAEHFGWFAFLYLVFAGGGPWSVDRVALKQD